MEQWLLKKYSSSSTGGTCQSPSQMMQCVWMFPWNWHPVLTFKLHIFQSKWSDHTHINVAEKYAIYLHWKGYMATNLGVWIHNYYADGKVNNWNNIQTYISRCFNFCLKVKVFMAQLCLTVFNPIDCSSPSSFVLGCPRQEYWSGLPFPSPKGLPNPGTQPGSPALQVDALQLKPPWKCPQIFFVAT